MLTTIFIFGLLISLTFTWLISCLIFLFPDPTAIGSISELAMVILAITSPPVLMWVIAGLVYNTVFVRKLTLFQSFLTIELKKSMENRNKKNDRTEQPKAFRTISFISFSLNSILSYILISLEAINANDLNQGWQAVSYGDKEAIAREFLKRINPSGLRARALESTDLKEKITVFCEHYEKLLDTIERCDSDGILGSVFAQTDFSRVYAIFSGISIKTILHRADDMQDEITLSKEDVIIQEALLELKTHILAEEEKEERLMVAELDLLISKEESKEIDLTNNRKRQESKPIISEENSKKTSFDLVAGEERPTLKISTSEESLKNTSFDFANHKDDFLNSYKNVDIGKGDKNDKKDT